jgi:hypothetical protein
MDTLSDKEMYLYYAHIRSTAPEEFKYMQRTLRYCDGSMQKYLEKRWCEERAYHSTELQVKITQ